MNRSFSAGAVCPFSCSAECSIVVRLYTLTLFSPAAATTLRESNCREVTAWSYRSVSAIAPVRRSQI